MISHYLVLFAISALGIFSLLGLQFFTRRQYLRRPMTAAWLTLLTLVWLTLPQEYRWVFSLWSPSTVLEGRLLLEMTPAVWLVGAVLAATFSGVAWIRVTDEQPARPLSGALTIFILLISWLALLSASLLMTLISWAIFDLFWGVAALISGSDDERITFGWAIHGIASLILWIVSLLLVREGSSTLWWLTQPSEALLALLLVTIILRVGLYPWHLVFPPRAKQIGLLLLAAASGPLLGFGLLYRLLSLPLELPFLTEMSTLGLLSLLWGGLRAWATRDERSSLLWAAYALLGGVIAGALSTGSASWLLRALAAWWAGWVLLLLSRRREGWFSLWSLPGILAVIFLLGIPPSPLGVLYRAALEATSWGGRLLLMLGLTLTGVVFLRVIERPAKGAVAPPWAWQRTALGVGLILPVTGMLSSSLLVGSGVWGWVLWIGVFMLMAVLVWQGDLVRVQVTRLRPIWKLLDLRWLQRTLWQGAEHLFGLMRTLIEVVEGNGALLWSLLMVLLVLLVGKNR